MQCTLLFTGQPLYIYTTIFVFLSPRVPTRKMDDVCMHECAMSRIRRKACQMEGFQEPPNKFQFWWQGCTWLQTVVLCLVTQVKILFTAVRWSENLKYVCLEVGKKQMTSLLVVTCQELLKSMEDRSRDSSSGIGRPWKKVFAIHGIAFHALPHEWERRD